MNIETKIDYSEIKPPRFVARFLSVVIDVVIVGIITLCFSFISISIFNNSAYYQGKVSSMKDEARVCYAMSEESHLITYNGTGSGDDHYSSNLDQTEVFKKTLYSHILLSYNTDSSYFASKGITSLAIDPSIKPANTEVDELAYFYYGFVKNNNDKYKLLDLSKKTYQEYHYETFKEYEAKSNDTSIWILNNIGDFPMLKGEYAYKAYMHLKSDTTVSDNETAYNALRSQYVNMWNKEYDVLTATETYSTHYQNYQMGYKEVSGYVDLLLVLSFVLGFILGYLLPVLASKLHRTIGKRVEYIFVASNNGDNPNKKQIVFRTLLKIFPYFGFSFISNMIVGIFNSSWAYAVFNIGSLGVSLSTFNIAFLIVAVVSLCFTIIDEKKRSIADFICKTRLIDYKEYKDRLCPSPSINDKTKIDKDDVVSEEFIRIDESSLEKNKEEEK